MSPLNARQATMTSVLQSIRQQTGYVFIAGNIDLSEIKVDVNVKNVPIDEALQACFKNVNLEYKIEDRTIVIKEKQPTTLDKLKNALNLDKIEVTGRVLDEYGQPISSATATVKGTGDGDHHRCAGYFKLKGVDDKAIIVISVIEGKKEMPAAENMGTIRMVVASNELDAVQVIAYGQTSQRLSTGNISTVSAKTIAEQPVDNPLLALEAQVPGLYINQVTGIAGGAVTAQVQGQNSMRNGNDPLYIIDGVPYTSELLPNLGGLLGQSSANPTLAYGGATGSPLNYLDLSNIESISILKDADATAIYGSRAANGAIIITTKKGKAGQTKVDLNMYEGWGQVDHEQQLLNTQQYLQVRNEAFKNDGTVPGPADYDLTSWSQTSNTNWEKVLIGGISHYSNVNANVSGGTADIQYLIGATYHDETSVFPGDFSDAKGGMHFNINSASSNQKFRIQLSGNYMVDNNQLPGIDLTSTALGLPPNAPAVRNPDGSINWAEVNGSTSFSHGQPLVYTLQPYNNLTDNLISSMVVSYQLAKGLEISSNFGYTDLRSNETNLFPLISYAPEVRPYVQRSATYGKNSIETWSIEPQLNYKKAIAKGVLTVLLGSSAQQNNSNGQQLYGLGYNSDKVLEDIGSAATIGINGTTAATYKYNAGFARINYNWEDKYIVSLSGRRDGSSRFGEANEFHDFEAGALAWIFSKETFFAHTFPFISFGKFSTSYGTTGNDQIGNYQYLSLYYPLPVGIPYQGIASLGSASLANPYIQWEETKKMNFAIDLGFFNDRILMNADYFLNRTSNELLNLPQPIITGYTSITENFPATVENSGWEFTLKTINIKSGSFSWSSSFNMTIPQNKLVAFPGLATSPYSSLFYIGDPINIIKVFDLVGVNPATGNYQFRDSQGNLTSNPAFGTDQTVVINTNPKFYGGFGNSLTFKSFQLDFLFQFVKKIAQNDKFGINGPGNALNNQPVSVLNAWSAPGDIASVQKYSENYSNYLQFYQASTSNQAYSDASFVRLKTLSLSWQVPSIWIQPLQASGIVSFTSRGRTC